MTHTETDYLVAEFMHFGGKITTVKPRKSRKRVWYGAAKGRATAFAQMRKCDANIRHNKHSSQDASYVSM